MKTEDLDLDGVDVELLEEVTKNQLERVKMENELYKAKKDFADVFKAEVVELRPQVVHPRTPLYTPEVVKKRWKYKLRDYWHNLKIVLGLEKQEQWN